MDEMNLSHILKDQGWIGVAGLLLAQYGRVAWKKWISGDYVSYKDLEKKILFMETTINEHLKAEAREDIMFAELKTDHSNLKQLMEKENGHIFHQIGSIFEKLDEQGQDLKEILKIMIEQKRKA